MKNSKVLHKLREELFTLSKFAPNRIISEAILRVATDFDNEFISWLQNRAKQNVKNSTNPMVLESLLFLTKLLAEHPEGMSQPDFVSYFVGTNNSKYLPSILSFKALYESSGSSILEPFAQIMSLANIFTKVGEFSPSEVENDLQNIEHIFRNYLETKINKPYGGEEKPQKGRLTKNEKKKSLFYYLIDQINSKMTSVLESIGRPELAEQINSDRLFFVNPQSLAASGLIGDSTNLFYISKQAEDVAKTILKRVDPSDNEYNYNLLINSAMKFTMAMTDDDYDKYFHNLMMQKAKGETEIKRVRFANQRWIHPSAISLISVTLLKIMSQINF